MDDEGWKIDDIKETKSESKGVGGFMVYSSSIPNLLSFIVSSLLRDPGE